MEEIKYLQKNADGALKSGVFECGENKGFFYADSHFSTYRGKIKDSMSYDEKVRTVCTNLDTTGEEPNYVVFYRGGYYDQNWSVLPIEEVVRGTELDGFPAEVLHKMQERVTEHNSKYTDLLFLCKNSQSRAGGKFNWDETKEKHSFWEEVINNKNFDKFYEKYPKDPGSDD